MRRGAAILMGAIGGVVASLLMMSVVMFVAKQGDAWLGFAGSVIGGLVTAIAAWVAFNGVERQIREMRSITRLELLEREAQRAANAILSAQSLKSWLTSIFERVPDHDFHTLASDVLTGLVDRAPGAHDISGAITKIFPSMDPLLASKVVSEIISLRDALNLPIQPSRMPASLEDIAAIRKISADNFRKITIEIEISIKDGFETISLYQRERRSIVYI